MSVSSVSGSNFFSLSGLGSTGSINQTSSSVSMSDIPSPPPHRHGGGFMSELKQALETLGADDDSDAVTSASSLSSSSDATSTQNIDSALNNFLQNLMASLHAQSSTNTSSSDSDSTDSASSASALAAASSAATVNRPPPPPKEAQLESDLTNLIQALSATESSSSATSSTDTSDTSTTTTAGNNSSSSSSTSALEGSFKELLSAIGGSDSTSLSSFLQSFSSKLHAMPPSGNIINTSA